MPLDRITESLLTEFSTEYGLTVLPEDKRFEHFAAYLAVNRHFGSTFDIGDTLTGSAIGIDAIAIIVNGTLVDDVETLDLLSEVTDYLEVTFIFVQADRAANFDVAKLGNFAFATKDFFEVEEPKLPRNIEMRQAAEIMEAIYARSGKFKRGNPTCRMYYITTGKLTGDATLESRRVIAEEDMRATELFNSVTLELLGRQEIQKLYRETKDAVAREFQFPSSMAVPDVAGVREAHIGLIPAPTIVSILQADDGTEMLTSIFYENVRDWQGDTAVNQEIRATLESPTKARFVLMNNGITIIARELRRTGDRFRIEDFQVVNGCQTSHVLFSHRDKLDASVMIPLRLIATQDEEIINAIIRGTNRQTEVKDEQFFALTSFPKLLEAYFASFTLPQRLYYERRAKQYSRLNVEKTRVVTQANLLRAFSAMFLDEPHRATRSAKSLIDKMGKEVFAKDHKLEPYYLTAYTAYQLEYRFRSARIPPGYKPARFHILLAVRLLANPSPLPQMNSKEMERYCMDITARLWDGGQADELFGRSVGAVEAIADKMAARTETGILNREIIRTLPFTEALMAECGAPRVPRAGTAATSEAERLEQQKGVRKSEIDVDEL